MEKYDLAVIGGGPGGYPAAIRAAQLGAAVAIIERESLGGTCLNWGCIPTKTLIAAAGLYAKMRHAGSFGISLEKIAFDYAAMTGKKNEVVAKLRSGIAALLKANGVALFEGTASFAGRNRIAVRPAKGDPLVLESVRTIVATGSTSALPAFLPQSPRIVESRAFLDLTQLPRTLLVLGGGVIGCELACLAAQLGVQVTIVELLPDILTMLDPDLRSVVRRNMENQLGIRIHAGQPAEAIAAGEAGIKVKAGGQNLDADLLLVAVGRRPVTDALALDQAGLIPNPKGFIPVNPSGQTRAATIYAVGDVTGGTLLAHAATAQGLAAAEHALGQRRASPAARLIPACIFTAPEVATVGLSEQEAKEQKRPIVTGKFPFLALGRALAGGEPDGFVKWISDATTDQLLGAQAVGAHATELIAEATLAIQAELTTREVARTIHAHPTYSEAWMEAAHAVHGECTHLAPKRKKTA